MGDSCTLSDLVVTRSPQSPRCLTDDRYRAVVIAVIAVRVVQVTIDKVVDMIAVGYRFVATAWAMNMI